MRSATQAGFFRWKNNGMEEGRRMSAGPRCHLPKALQSTSLRFVWLAQFWETEGKFTAGRK
jgi:hypothetical protein